MGILFVPSSENSVYYAVSIGIETNRKLKKSCLNQDLLKIITIMEWNQLRDRLEIEELLLASENQKVVIFKHSTRCGISSMVLRRFEKEVASLKSDNVSFYFLDLIAHRETSNAIASTLAVNHESPQLIIIENRKVTHHSSHAEISTDILSE